MKEIVEVHNDITYKFESSKVKSMISMKEILDTVEKNSNKFVSFFQTHKWTFYFRRFMCNEHSELNEVFFSVDYDNKQINFNTLILTSSDLLSHYISFAIIHTCDSKFLRSSFAEHYSFQAEMMNSFSKFVQVAYSTVIKMCDAFTYFNCYDESLPIKFSYEYVSPYKFLYEAYALYVDGNEELFKECSNLCKILKTIYF